MERSSHKSKSHKQQRTQKKSTASVEVKKHITAMVDHIPEIVSDELSTYSFTKQTSPNTVHVEQSKKKLLWIGVTCLVVVIFAMWILNTKAFFYSWQANQTKNPLVTTAQDDFSALMATLEEQSKADDAMLTEIKIQEALSTLLVTSTQP